jgi:hypothetical protein
MRPPSCCKCDVISMKNYFRVQIEKRGTVKIFLTFFFIAGFAAYISDCCS